jgi:hypothetical protein
MRATCPVHLILICVHKLYSVECKIVRESLRMWEEAVVAHGLWKPSKTSAMIAGLRAQIWTRDLQNTKPVVLTTISLRSICP